MASWLMVVAPFQAVAQVRCTMPNGLVIEQQFSPTCPQGALKAETLGGAPAEVRKPDLAPAQPLRKGAQGRAVQTVSSAEFGGVWPLTVDSGELRCEVVDFDRPQLVSLLFAYEGRVYTLNGIAAGQAAKQGWGDVRALWRDNPSIPGTKMPITPITERAQSLCGAVLPSSPARVSVPSAASVVADDDGAPVGILLFVVVGAAALVMAIRGSAARRRR